MEDNNNKKSTIESNIADIGLGKVDSEGRKSQKIANNKGRKLFQSSSSGNDPRKQGRKRFKRFSRRKESPYKEQVVSINRVSKTTKGGRKISFNALVVVGDKKGRVGFALAKAAEVPTAIKKAIKKAEQNVISIPLTKNNSISHQIIGKAGSGRVFLRNAPDGTGVVAGSATRVILELAGIQNIYTKIQGSKTKINVVRATMNGLKNLKVPSKIAFLRDKDIKEL